MLVVVLGFTAILGEVISLSSIALVWHRMLIAFVLTFLFLIYRKYNLRVTLRDFIKNGDLESAIGCSYSDAQRNADISALHEDFLDGVHEVTDKIEGKWDWDTHTLKGRISVCDIMNHDAALDILSDSLEQGYRWVDVVDTIVEREWEDVWNGDEGDVLFGEPVTIDGYKHFRYGGAGTLDKQEFNEYLHNRLYDEYSSFM